MNNIYANTGNAVDLVARGPVDKKKIIIAVALLVIMAFMWGRVLLKGKSGPDEATAGQTDTDKQTQEPQKQIELAYSKLPLVTGRNDRLSSDVFTCYSWAAFQKDSTGRSVDDSASVDVGLEDGQQRLHQANIQQIAESIKLDAIIAGEQNQAPCALIEDKLVSVGSKLVVTYDDQIYDFTVSEIEKDKVVLKWQSFTITSKISQPGMEE